MNHITYHYRLANMNIAEQNNYYTINVMCTSTANLQGENKTDQFLGASMDSGGDSFVVRTVYFFVIWAQYSI